MKTLRIVVTFISILYINNLFGQAIPFDPQVRTGKLANGFTYYIRNNNEPAGQIELRLVVKAGTMYEEKDQLGLAHLTEHMGFKGLEHFPNGIHDYLYKNGVGKGEVNAYTAGIYTCYELPIASGKKELLDSSLLILKDWCHGFLLRDKEIDEERGAIIREVNGGGDAGQDMVRTDARLLRHPKYSEEAVNKLVANYNQFAYSSLKRFYEKWYWPERQAAIIVGDVDVDEVERKIKQLFSALPNKAVDVKQDSILAAWAVQPDGKNNFIKINNDRSPVIIFQLYNKMPGQIKFLQKTTVEQYRLEIRDKLYAEMTGFRFGTLPESASFNTLASHVDRGTIIRSAQLDALFSHIEIDASRPVKAAFQAALSELEKISRYGFEEEELTDARQWVKKAYGRDAQLRSSKGLVGKYIDYFVWGASAPAPDYELALINKLVDEVSLKEMNRYAKTWMNQVGNRDIVVKGPSGALSQVKEETVQGWIAEVKKMNIQPGAGMKNVKEVVAAMQWPLPGAGATVAESQIKSIGVKEIKLANGIKVVLKPVKQAVRQSGRILLEAYAPGGYERYIGADSLVASTAAVDVKKGIVGGLSPLDLKKYLWGTGTVVTPFINKEEHGFYAFANTDAFETMLRLLYLYVTAPRNEAKPDRAHAIYNECFADIHGLVFIMTGDFSIQDIRPLIEQYLGALSSSEKSTLVADPLKNQVPAPGVLKSITKNNASSASVNMRLRGNYRFSEFSMLKIKLLSRVLDIVLYNRIRGKEGATYGVNADVSYSRQGNYEFVINFETDPGKAERMAQAVLEEIEKIQSVGINADILQQAVSQQMNGRELNMSSGRTWLDYLAVQYRNGEDPEAVFYRKVVLANITANDLQEMAIELLNTKNFLDSKK